jgi:glycine oxidase
MVRMGGGMRVDVAIAGGGIIGLSLGLELRRRGLSVVVLERGQAMRAASWAAGGMLAVDDPQNPKELMPLARLSREIYPEWLARVEGLAGMKVPLRTGSTLQWVASEGGRAETASVECERVEGELATAEEIRELAPGLRAEGLCFRLLEEASLDPRDLCAALPPAFKAAGGKLAEECEVVGVERAGAEAGVGVVVQTRRAGETSELGSEQSEIAAGNFVNCCGAWAGSLVQAKASPIGGKESHDLPVEPVKGQMVELRCGPERLKCVVRGRGVYLIPRGDGRVTAGSTMERVGFDERVEERAIAGLVRAAQNLIPELEMTDPLECWAGLRPGTPDGLPMMGRAEMNGCWYATGHYRDGILLAPGTAWVMAQAMMDERTDVELEAFRPVRFRS